jgi:hypothetical protein
VALRASCRSDSHAQTWELQPHVRKLNSLGGRFVFCRRLRLPGLGLDSVCHQCVRTVSETGGSHLARLFSGSSNRSVCIRRAAAPAGGNRTECRIPVRDLHYHRRQHVGGAWVQMFIIARFSWRQLVRTRVHLRKLSGALSLVCRRCDLEIQHHSWPSLCRRPCSSWCGPLRSVCEVAHCHFLE